MLSAALSLALFSWLRSMHPTAAGRVYAAYGGVYIGVAALNFGSSMALGQPVTDFIGVAVSLVGMGIIMFGPRSAA
ncbi:hypothetical protein [Ramlibacter aurantiacus]|uniref:hypothetical protein n=1 Tax=Ramlibacter aurantiacus TaxID=2801330 RepID=UPI00210843D7|nr:hypothetical protein [Ramlibacter aurantiacus]